MIPQMRLLLLAVLILPGCTSQSERVFYVSLPKASAVSQGQSVYRYGLPVGVVRAATPAGDSVHLRIAMTRKDAPVHRNDHVQLVVGPLGEERLELHDSPMPGPQAQSGDTLASLPSIRQDSITAAAVEALPNLYRDAKRVRDRLKGSSP
jgi:ABC-type transporter Mla subunit MlaD